MLNRQLLSMLLCPTCQKAGLHATAELDGDTVPDHATLRCDACAAEYPLRSGYPVLLPEESLEGEDWGLWRSHLDKFQERRQARVEEPNHLINRLAERSQPQPSFARFTGIRSGRVLDVGCGPGKFRHQLDERHVQYVGIDPITLPDVATFDFVQGLAEHLPFKDGTFTDVVVLAALDHFCDLNRFFAEVARVLQPGGHLHILQSVHGARGPISAIKVLGHKIKDALEERHSPVDKEVPKHLSEFTDRTLLDRLETDFEIVSRDTYSGTWYAPEKMFLSCVPRAKGSERLRAS